MRDFAKVAPSTWQGEIKKLRGDANAIAVHYHLTTSPHSTMIGVFHCPIAYIANDIGISLEEASKGLQRLIEGDICSYDEGRELVWVHEMAATQIAASLNPNDKQVAGVARQLAQLQKCAVTLGFYGRYRDAFCLRNRPELVEYERDVQGPSMPLRSKEKETEQDQKKQGGSRPSELSPAQTQARVADHPDWTEVDWQLFHSRFAHQIEAGDSEFQANALANDAVEKARRHRANLAATAENASLPQTRDALSAPNALSVSDGLLASRLVSRPRREPARGAA